jgi:Ca2+:H+ antiporter
VGAAALLAALAAITLRVASASALVVFVAAAIAVALLAWILGVATEHASEAASPRIAALLNATFGNAPEALIIVLSVRAGLVDVAKASIVGSVIGNLLFVLGASLVASGVRHGVARFDARAAGVNATMLVLATFALGLPTLFAASSGRASHAVALSRGVAVVGVATYILYLVWSLRRSTPPAAESEADAAWPAALAVAVLCVTAVLTAVVSEVLVASITPVIRQTGMSRVFLGLILIPLIGNVAEHLSAVRAAWRGKLDLAMGIVFGSALQVSLALTGLAVAAGFVFDRAVTLQFTAFELAVMAAATLVCGLIAASGVANWIEGAQLLAVYAIAALVFWYL